MPMNALRNLGPVEALRCVGSYVWARVRPPKDQDTLEGFIVAPLRVAALRALLQDLQREGLGRARLGDLGRLRRAARQGPVAVARGVGAEAERVCAGARQVEAGHQPDRGVQVPEVRARADVGDARPRWSRPPAPRSYFDAQGRAHRARRRTVRTWWSRVDADGDEHATRARTSSRRCRSARCAEAMDPPVADERARPRPTLALPRLHDRRARRARRSTAFPDNWIYIHDPDVEVGRIQNFGSWSPYLVKEGRTCLGLEFFVYEGDEMWTKADDDLIEQGKRELEQLGLGRRVEGRGRLRRADAEGLPVYDEHYQANVDDAAQVARRRARPTSTRSAATACTSTTTRTTRCTRRCSRSRTSSAPHHDVWAVNVEEEYHEERRGRRRRRPTGRERPVLPRRALDAAASRRRARAREDRRGPRPVEPFFDVSACSSWYSSRRSRSRRRVRAVRCSRPRASR